MDRTEQRLRKDIVSACRRMIADGLTHGTAGNISARHGKRMLITPSAVPYEDLEPEMIAAMDLDAESEDGDYEGPLKPSTEWHFHRDILRSRGEVGAVVHAHAPYATVLAIARKPIPPVHYMIAAFGGDDIRCAPYARFGTKELSRLAVRALEKRNGCLLANHGMIAVGPTLAKAMWLAFELETLARQYHQSLLIGGPVLLSKKEIADAASAFAGYGHVER